MIDTIEQTNCKVCGEPIEQKGGKGHRQRVFCSGRCKQTDYRHTHHGVTNDVTTEDDRQALDQKNIAVYQEKLATCAARIEKLEHQVEVQRQRLSQSYQSTDAQNIKRIEQYAIDCSIAEGKAKERIAELEQELARYRKIVDLGDRQKMIVQFMLTGEEIGYKALSSVDVRPGAHAWYAFSQTADNEHLAAGVVAAKNLYKILADLQTTREVEQLNKIIADLRLERNALKQELEECHNRTQS